jgi:hypothetical protein
MDENSNESQFIKNVRLDKDRMSKQLYNNLTAYNPGSFNKLPKKIKDIMNEHSRAMGVYLESVISTIKAFDSLSENDKKKFI